MGLRNSYTKSLLFHYTTRETAIEYILRNMTIKLAALTGTNDLRETEPWYFGASIEDEELSPSSEEFLSANKEIDRTIKGGCRIACFSEDRPDLRPELDPDKYHRPDLIPQGYAHDRMWAQYAGNHGGVCIFFDRAKLISRMQEHFRGRSGQLLYGSVYYADSMSLREDPLHVSWDEVRRLGIAQFSKLHRAKFARQIYLTKNPDWSSEQEFRFVWVEDEGEGPQAEYVPIEGCVSALCLGGRFPQAYEVNIKDIKARLDVPVHKIHYMRGLQIRPALEDPPPPYVPPRPTVQLDQPFGKAGIATARFADQSQGTALLLQSDGKIVVGGRGAFRRANGTYRRGMFVLSRFDVTGQLDSSFGADGLVSDDAGGLGTEVRALATQSDGKIFALSTPMIDRKSHSFVSSFLPDGSLDTSWGQGGVLRALIGEGFEAYGQAVAAGGLVIAGTCTLRSSSGESDYPLVIARYTKDGHLKQSFGRNGVVVTGFNGQVTRSNGLIVQRDGKIVVGGSLGFGDGAQYAVMRYLENGSIDLKFGESGVSVVGAHPQVKGFWGYAASLQSTGKIVIVGTAHGAGSSSEWAVVRLNPDGSLDSGFGEKGIVKTEVRKGAQWSRACSLAIQSDDSMVVGGFAVGACAVVRYVADGSIDQGFGERGIGIVSFRAQEGQQMLAVQADRKIVMGGVAEIEGVHVIGAARYN